MIKPIETVYNGYRFRSRLEARYAVFFDTLGIPWEYEKEGYDLDGVWYLPDFWLPEQGVWVEIKGSDPTDEELDKLRALACATRKTAHLFSGEIKIPPETASLGWSARFWAKDEGFWGVDWDWHPMFTVCPHCNDIGITTLGKTSLLPCKCSQQHHYTENFEYNACEPQIVAAYTAARQARFEHNR